MKTPKTPQVLVMGAHGPMRLFSSREMARSTRRVPPNDHSVKKAMTQGQREYRLSEKARLQCIEMKARRLLTKEYPSTRGNPQGWSGRVGQRKLKEARSRGQEKATIIMDELIKQGIVQKDDAGNAALAFGVEVIVTQDEDKKPVYTVGDRLKAARMVLDFTMSKPEQKTKVSVESAEDWLNKLAGPDTATE